MAAPDGPLGATSRLERWRAVVLLLASTLTIMSAATIAPSLPALEARFAGQENAALLIRLVLTMPALFIAVCAPVAGLVADRWGRRPLLLCSVALYGLAGMSGLVLDTLPGLLGGRALLGVAVAGVMTASTALVGDYFQGTARSRFMGFQAGFSSIGGIVFLTVGGLLADSHWRAPFGIYGLALAMIPAIFLFLPEPRGAAYDGGAETEKNTANKGAWRVLAAVFFAAMVNSVAFYSIPTQLPFFLKTLGVPEASRAGLAIAMVNVAAAGSAFAYTRVRARMKPAAVFTMAFALMAAGFVLVAGATDYGAVLGAMTALGTGLGFLMPSLTGAVLQNAPAALRGRVSGGLTASIFIGHFISPILTQPIIAASGYAGAYVWMGGMMGALALAGPAILVLNRLRAG